MLAGSGTSMLVPSGSAAAGRTATGVAEAATGCDWTATDAGLMPYGSPAKVVALATTLEPATIITDTKRRNNGRGFILVDQPHRVPPGSRVAKARLIPFSNTEYGNVGLTGSPTPVVRSGRSGTLQDS
jgi:hypothetical protein